MNKVRLVLVVDEELREALRLESALSGEDMSDIAARLLRENLGDAIATIRSRRSGGTKPAQKRGRPSRDAETE